MMEEKARQWGQHMQRHRGWHRLSGVRKQHGFLTANIKWKKQLGDPSKCHTAC